MEYTQYITPTENPIILEIPKEMIGHKVRVTLDDADIEKEKKAGLEEALAFWRSQQVDTTGFKFDREEANERFH